MATEKELEQEAVQLNARLEALYDNTFETLFSADRENLNREIKEIEDRLEAIKGETNDAIRAENAALIAARREEANHWYRRFYPSLAIGNGAAFFAISTGLMQADRLPEAAQLGRWPLLAFGLGVIAAGLLPHMLAKLAETMTEAQRKRQSTWSTWVAGFSALGFTAGILSAIISVWLVSFRDQPSSAKHPDAPPAAAAQSVASQPANAGATRSSPSR